MRRRRRRRERRCDSMGPAHCCWPHPVHSRPMDLIAMLLEIFHFDFVFEGRMVLVHYCPNWWSFLCALLCCSIPLCRLFDRRLLLHRPVPQQQQQLVHSNYFVDCLLLFGVELDNSLELDLHDYVIRMARQNLCAEEKEHLIFFFFLKWKYGEFQQPTSAVDDTNDTSKWIRSAHCIFWIIRPFSIDIDHSAIL